MTAPTRLPLPELLRDLAARHPERVLVSQAETGRTQTAAQLWQRAVDWTDRLRAQGVVPGDHVATMTGNTAECFALWVGIALAGAIEIPVSVELRGSALEHVFAESRATLLVVDDRGREALATDATGLAGIRTVLTTTVDRPGANRWLPVGIDVVPCPPREVDPTPETGMRLPGSTDIALVLFTSGTTGPAKGVLVPWGQLLSTCEGAFPVDATGPDRCMYSAFPPNHISARTLPYLAWLRGGRAVLRERFSASAFWDDVDRHGCTTTALAATMGVFLLGAPSTPDDHAHALRDVMIAPLIENWETFAARFGVRVCTLFTMTEVSTPLASGWGPDRPTTCGYLRQGYPGYEARLVDADDRDVPVGEPGELAVRTAEPGTLNAGYLHREEETRHAWRGGWFHTGDWFRRDEQGRYQFAGRMKDAIRHRGENVSAYEVEREVLRTDGVAGCAAVGVPSADAEEDVYLFVVPEEGVDIDTTRLLEELRPRLARYMMPSYVHVVDALPLTATGKAHKTRLRDLARSQLAGTA
ncbi:AMP-binding protein [Pseudonocardia pini]|uniref:AMP-binding protein n=1 Tax=Pseudonocardia pini TaxID=2758030 RepID=UPI0015F00230|nr:AMP-binding protein [Pseudonocardia pini]